MGNAAEIERRIRRMTPVSAPAEQRAGVAALSRLLEAVAHKAPARKPKCQLAGPDGERVPIPESVFKHRRVRIEDVLAFAETRDKDRSTALAKLTQMSEELAGYSELK